MSQNPVGRPKGDLHYTRKSIGMPRVLWDFLGFASASLHYNSNNSSLLRDLICNAIHTDPRFNSMLAEWYKYQIQAGRQKDNYLLDKVIAQSEKRFYGEETEEGEMAHEG